MSILESSARLAGFALAACAVALGGCAEQQTERELQHVAKSWCQTIRASQVIPVYPLTEDLRPGDVFLVRRTIADQASEWKEKGFLALDDHRVRLDYPLEKDANGQPIPMASMYQRMYHDGYFKDTFGAAPHPRPVIADPGTLVGADGKPLPVDDARLARFTSAEIPRAAFPSYSFQVRSGGGLGLAVPISGVPVGLSFMQTGSADGTATIADAYTYGADARSLYNKLFAWVTNNPQVAAMLDDAVRGTHGPVFLRVVSRVYLTGAMSVSLTNRETGGAEVRGGAKVDVKIVDDQGDLTNNYKELLKALDERANAALPMSGSNYLPGGSVKFAWASSRSVALHQTFPTPLVVGYLGFDVPVYEGADLGFPVPTWLVLNEKVSVPEQTHFDPMMQDALRGLVNGSTPNPTAALGVIVDVADALADILEGSPETARWIQISRDGKALAEKAAARQDVSDPTRDLFNRFDLECSMFTSLPRRQHTLDRLIERAYRAHVR